MTDYHQSDPFLTGTHGNRQGRGRGQKPVEQTGMGYGQVPLTVIPWMTYVTITLCYAFFYHLFKEVVWLVSLAFCAMALVYLCGESHARELVHVHGSSHADGGRL